MKISDLELTNALQFREANELEEDLNAAMMILALLQCCTLSPKRQKKDALNAAARENAMANDLEQSLKATE